MSNLYSIYQHFKKEDSNILLLFKCGLFYIFIDEDAKLISNKFGLKITNLNPSIVKCGFPTNSLSKYLNIFINNNLSIKIIEDSTIYSINEFIIKSDISNLLTEISLTNENNLSVKEAYEFISKIKEKCNKILSEV